MRVWFYQFRMSVVNVMDRITPAQARAARALLQFRQEYICTKAELSHQSVSAFENGNRGLLRHNMRALISAYVAEGVEFIEDGVRLKRLG